MNLFINGKFVNVIEYETDIDGLKFRPQFDFQYNNDSDWESFTLPHSQEVSQKNYNLVKEITSNYMAHGVMEIGISRNGDGSLSLSFEFKHYFQVFIRLSLQHLECILRF